MKVLYISAYPPAHDGIGNYTWVLASAVRDAGAAVGVIVPWQISDAPNEVIGSLSGGEYRKLRSLVVRWRPDVIHIQFAIAAFGTRTIALMRWINAIRRNHHIPVVVTLHEFTREATLLPVVGRTVYRWIAMHCDQLIVHTDVALKAVVSRFGISETKVAVIPHPTSPAPTASSSCDELRSRFALGDARVLLAFGFIHVDKGLDDLVQALRILSRTDRAALGKVILVIAGAVRPRRGLFRAFEFRDRLYLRRVLRMARRGHLLDNVRLTGYVPLGEVAAWFSLAEVVLLPYRRIEESGVASLARSFSAPVLASTAGGLAEQFAGSKWSFPPASPEDLAETLGRFLGASQSEREASPVADRPDDLTSVVTRTLGLYQALVSAQKQGKVSNVA